MIRLSKETGFSLVELMIVVAIMAILAAIAIPSFLKFQSKAKESEAINNLAAIRTCEESYRAENDQYLVCTASPTDIPVATSVPWEDMGADGSSFDDIGFEASGQVRFQYEVANPLAADPMIHYEAYAKGDLTGNDLITFTMTDTAPKPVKTVTP